jgi:hypothetical protein
MKTTRMTKFKREIFPSIEVTFFILLRLSEEKWRRFLSPMRSVLAPEQPSDRHVLRSRLIRCAAHHAPGRPSKSMRPNLGNSRIGAPWLQETLHAKRGMLALRARRLQPL